MYIGLWGFLVAASPLYPVLQCVLAPFRPGFGADLPVLVNLRALRILFSVSSIRLSSLSSLRAISLAADA